MMVVALLGEFTKNHCIVNLEWVDFMIYKILLHEVVKKSLSSQSGNETICNSTCGTSLSPGKSQVLHKY